MQPAENILEQRSLAPLVLKPLHVSSVATTHRRHTGRTISQVIPNDVQQASLIKQILIEQHYFHEAAYVNKGSFVDSKAFEQMPDFMFFDRILASQSTQGTDYRCAIV